MNLNGFDSCQKRAQSLFCRRWAESVSSVRVPVSTGYEARHRNEFQRTVSWKNWMRWLTTLTVLSLAILTNVTIANIGFAAPPATPPALFALTGSSVGTYDPTSGAVINANLIQAFSSGSNGLAVSGSAMFLINGNSIGKYNANFGTVINANFIRPLFNGSSGLLISGNTLFVTNNGAGTVGNGAKIRQLCDDCGVG